MTVPRRRWFSFSLRTMFVVVTIVGCWLGYQLNWIRQRRQFLRVEGHTAHNATLAHPMPTRAPSLLWLLGEPGYADIEVWDGVDGPEAERLFPEAEMMPAYPSGPLEPPW